MKRRFDLELAHLTPLLLLAFTACGISTDDKAEESALAKIPPAQVSNAGAWTLFDRSIESGFVAGAEPVRVDFDKQEQISAIKIFGPSPYRLDVRGRDGSWIGFVPIDLSQLRVGWNVIESTAVVSTNRVELRFQPMGTPTKVPEIELWGVDSAEVVPYPDLTAADMSSGYIAMRSSADAGELSAGACAKFDLEIPRASSTFRTAYVVYDAEGLFRSFAVRMSVNGRGERGGSWLPEKTVGKRPFVEEISPELLRTGRNEIQMCVPKNATNTVTVSNVRVIAKLDRGVGLITAVEIGNDDSDVSALHDGERYAGTQISSASKVRLRFDRLVAPDALVVVGSPVDERTIRTVECVSRNGARQAIATKPRTAGTNGYVIELDGAAQKCAALELAFAVNVSIVDFDVIGSGAAERVDWPRIVVTSEREHFGTLGWVAGFVTRPAVMPGTIRTNVAGVSQDSMTGEFGQLLERKTDVAAAWPVVVTATYPDGSTEQHQVVLGTDASAQLAVGTSATNGGASSAKDDAMFGRVGDEVVGRASLMRSAKIRLGTRVGIDVPAGAVSTATTITARHLATASLPPLDAGMINVTAPRGHGYEFLPHGQRFRAPVEVVVPFDPGLLPDGMKREDVHTYYFDTKSRRWRKLDRKGIDPAELTVRSSTDHFTIMINAVLAVPANPTPLSFDPTAISSIAAASPAAGIDLIEAPSANPTGDARMSLPIRVPAGRGAYTPSLAITYSSSGGNGWLGVGWDLAVPRIEIDTRWGVPRYTNTEEPRYVLDGSELVPTQEVEGPTCPNARRYHTRVEGAYAHILRCGSDPSSYYWIIHDRDGTKFRYGSDTSTEVGDSSVRSYKPRPCGMGTCTGGIFRWYLRKVVDQNGNTTTFSYQVDDIAGAEPSRQVYPQKIEYTSHTSMPAAYSVEFILDDGSRVDRTVSGRSGFKMTTRKLLRKIRVKFQSQIIRDYVLSYSPGQFQKTLLSSARMFGLGGCAATSNAFAIPSCGGEYHEHSFEYHADPAEESFGVVTQWCAAETNGTCDTIPTTTTLGKGKSTSWTGGMSIGTEIGGVVTVSGGVQFTRGDRLEQVGMYDLNSDGLVDQVFVDSANNIKWLASDGNSLNTLTAPGIPTLPSLGADHQASWGVNATLGIKTGGFGASASGGFSNATSRADKFFTDIDGDGYLDYLVAKGQSLSSKLCSGAPCFAPLAFDATSLIDASQDPLLNAFAAEIKERSIPGAPVVQWVAPYSGTVTVLGGVKLRRPGTADGVSVGLYHQDTLLLSGTVANFGSSFSISTTVQVAAGEALYLYVATGANDGISAEELRDEIELDHGNPFRIQYTSVCTDATCAQTITPVPAIEPTGRSVYEFYAAQETRVVAARPFRAPVKGTLKIEGTVIKTLSAAPLRYCLQVFPAGTTDFDEPCPPPPTVGTFEVDDQYIGLIPYLSPPNLNIEAGELVVLRAEADYTFDPDSLWFAETNQKPRISYTKACLPNGAGGCNDTTDPEELGQIAIDHKAFGFFPAPISAPQPDGAPPIPWIADGCASYQFPAAGFANPLGNTPITIAVRTNLQRTIQTFQCSGAWCMPPNPNGLYNFASGEFVSIEVIADPVVLPATSTTIPLVCDAPPVRNIPIIFRNKHADPTYLTPFVGGFRGWNVTFWNEHEPFAPAALIEAYADLYALPGCAPPPATPPDPTLCRTNLERVVRTAITPVPAFDGTLLTNNLRTWVGPGGPAFINPIGRQHAAGIGGLGPDVPGGEAMPGAGLFSPNYARLSGTRSWYAGFGAPGGDILPSLPGLTGGSLDASVTRSYTKTTTDVVDMNGDGIADVVAGNSAFQGSVTATPGGALGFTFDGAFRQRSGTDYTVGTGVRAATALTSPGGRSRMEQSQSSDSDLGVGTSRGLSIGRSQTTDDLVDINGDGLPDRVQRRGYNINVQYNLGTQFGAWETVGSMASALADAKIDGFQAFEEATDILGNPLENARDALTHDTTLTQHESWNINLFIASFSKTTRTTSSRTTRQLADLNGDGLPDLIFKKSGAPIKVQYNRGMDFGPIQTWTTPAWSQQLSPSFHSVFNPLLTAGSYIVTGPDVLAGTSSQESSSIGGELNSGPLFGPVQVGVSASRATDTDTYELSLLDINGDGRPDHVLRRTQSSGDNRIYVKPNRLSIKSNLLVTVHRPLGGTINIDYQSAGNTTDMPHRREVMSRVEIDDGVDLDQGSGDNFASPNMVTTFEYTDGFYSRVEKEFFGFAKVVTRRCTVPLSTGCLLDEGTIQQEYNNTDFALQGRLAAETRVDSSSRELQRHVIQYQVGPVIGPNGALGAHPACVGALHALLQRVGPNGDEACVPQAVRVILDSDTRSEDGLISKTRTSQDTSHDRFGNVLISTDTGDASVANDDLYVTVAYQNDTTSWILGRPTSIEVRAGSPNAAVLRSRTGSYYPNGKIQFVNVATGSGTATTGLAYDSFGNLNYLETPPNIHGDAQRYSIQYDPTVGTYPIRTEDAFGLVSTANYDFKFGVATTQADVNGVQITRTLDGFGRLETVTGPYDSAPGLTMQYFPNESPPRAVTVTQPSSSDGTSLAPLTTVTLIDGLGRAIELRKTSMVKGDLGMTTSGLVQRDSLGRVTKAWQPFFNLGVSSSFITPIATLATANSYDQLDRVTTVTHPDSNTEDTQYTIETAPNGQLLFKTRHTIHMPTLDEVRDAYTDHLDRTRVYVEHPASGTNAVTTYDYAGTGELKAIVDAEGNTTTLDYDLRGLRTSLSNPDTGAISESYDLMGNRTTLIDPNLNANGTQITYAYSYDRLIAIEYPSTPTTPDVAYKYGAPGEADGRAGRLVSVVDESGTQEYFYGRLGEVVRTVRTVKANGDTFEFHHHFLHDSIGRLLEVQYPDGEVVRNTYDAGGLLEQVEGKGDGWSLVYAQQMEYDQFGNRTQLVTGDGAGKIVRTWDYDPARVRLSRMRSALPTTTIQDLNYLYDPAGNPTQITNQLDPLTTTSGSRPGPSSVTFAYDGVSRLVHAVGSAQLDSSTTTTYDQSFSYTLSHNLDTKSRAHLVGSIAPPETNFSSTYQYSTRPHLPDYVGDLRIEYDGSGNPTARENLVTGFRQDLTWDDDGRMVQVKDTNGMTQTNVYDASGLRVLRSSIDPSKKHQTIFASQYFDVEGDEVALDSDGGVKHIFAGELRIATVLGHFSGKDAPDRPKTPGAIYYTHSDHLGSTSVITDESGDVQQSLEYFPDGETWIDRAPAMPLNGYLFNGKPFDTETGFYDYGQRFYDPRTSLWLGVDPAFVDSPLLAVGMPVSLSHGAYAAWSPVLLTDPDGRFPGLSDIGDAFRTMGAAIARGGHIGAAKLKNFASNAYHHPIDTALSVGKRAAFPAIGLYEDAQAAGEFAAELYIAAQDNGAKGVAIKLAEKGGELGFNFAVSKVAQFVKNVPKRALRSGRTGAPADVKAGACVGDLCPCFVAGTPIDSDIGSRPIEQIRLGDRVGPEFDTCARTDFTSWREVDLAMNVENAGVPDELELRLLRPEVWIRDHGVHEGGLIYVTLDDLNVYGFARVTRLGNAGHIEGGTRCPVTGWVRHTSHDIIALTLEGDETLHVTRHHRLFSADRQDWVQAGDVAEGEALRTKHAFVRAKRVGDQALAPNEVFNIEVFGAHAYFVGKHKVLAHNAYLKPEAKYLRGGKHGVNWKEGPALAKDSGKSQGQWGSAADLDYAATQADTLKPGEAGTFDLPSGHSSVVHKPDGTTVPASKIWVRNNGTGTFHGYPVE